MAASIDIIQKLIALAMNNPDESESLRAAFKAVSLIVQHNVTLEGQSSMGFTNAAAAPKWKPDAEFEEFWAKVQKDTRTEEGYDSTAGQSSGPKGIKVAEVDNELDGDFMRTRIKVAWRAIQRERARLRTEIYTWEQRYGHRYPRPEPKDWEGE